LVVAVGWLSVPQAPDGLAAVAKLTVSPDTIAPVAFVTVAVTIAVLAPSAGRLDRLVVRAIVLGCMNCVMTVEPLLAESASVAVIVQSPATIAAV
jgi:hypothetical protein